MSNPIKAGPFLGINNKLPVEKLTVPSKQGHPGGTFVRDALNVDLTEVGTLQRRSGTTLVQGTTRASSLWSAGDVGYFVDDGKIKQFNGTAIADVADQLTTGADVSFAMTPRGAVWTDGAAPQLISGLTSGPLAVPEVNPVPLAYATTGGSLQAGTYMVAFAAIDPDGERSAVSVYQAVTVGNGGAIALSLPVFTRATMVFVNTVGGDIMYHQADVPAGTASFTLGTVGATGLPIGNEFEATLPGGTWVRHYRGRLLTVSGNAILYSHPYNYGLYYPAKNYIMLDGPVTLCEPTQDGVFLATANDTWFLRGHDVATAELVPIAPYGAIPNTAAAEPNTLNLWWSTSRGAVRTTDSNTLEMRQDDHIAFSHASSGAALFREENGLSQIISALSNAQPTGAASASSYMSATTVN